MTTAYYNESQRNAYLAFLILESFLKFRQNSQGLKLILILDRCNRYYYYCLIYIKFQKLSQAYSLFPRKV